MIDTKLFFHKEKRRQTTTQKPLTVRLLVPGAGTETSELLGLAATGVSNEEGPVVGQEDVLDLLLGGLVHKLLVVGNNSLREGLADGYREEERKKKERRKKERKKLHFEFHAIHFHQKFQ